ncbi:MAG: BamA/TamA family outer membrane protein [Fimbriimonadaceae bacterium]|nr:BamA/TamA family outer membrane protein [Fimbriimonadaceae bacterium]
MTSNGSARAISVSLLLVTLPSAFAQSEATITKDYAFTQNSRVAQANNVITQIEIKGLVNVNQEIIEATMRTKVSQPYIVSQLEADKRAIEDLGFFQAVDVRAREQGDGSWIVTVEVIEYPKIKEIRVVGNKAVSTEEILKVLETAPALPVIPGNLFNLKSVRACSEGIRNLYAKKGFFGQVDVFGPLSEAPEVINVQIIELTVNSVSVQNATRTKPSVLNKLIRTRPNEPFNANKWRSDLLRLYNTQWFEKVDSLERATDDIGRVDLIADVKEQRTGIINFGLQLDPRNNIAGFGRYTDTNFKGSGQTVGISLLHGSTGGASVDLDYANPFIDNRETNFSASVYSRVLFRFSGVGFGGNDTPTEDNRFYERRTGTTIAITRPIKSGGTSYFSTAFRFENVVSNNLDDLNQNTGFIQQDGDVASIIFAVTRNRRDTDIEPSQGDYLRVSLEPLYSNITKIGGDALNDNILGSNFSFKTSLEYRKYWSPQPARTKLDDPRRVVAFRARLGAISGEVPFFEQFFAGGADSLRGYPDDRFWGKYFANATVEYRHPIQKAFNAILFVDYGSVWGGYGSVNDFTQTKRPDFQLGYGIGFSFRSPLGPIRLDFGFRQGGGSRTHFQIGTSF